MSTSQSSTVSTNELGRHEYEYREVLLVIDSNLTEVQKKKLRFYFPTECAEGNETLELFRSLEDDKMISWEDVCLLKDGLRAVGRLDLVDNLTEFENKRDLFTLVYMYARKRQGFEESSCYLSSVEQAAAYLTRTTTNGISPDGTLKSLLESRKSIKKVIGEFDAVIEHERLDPLNQLTLTVVIAGETVAEAFRMSEERRLTSEDIIKMCRSVADELYCRMREQGMTWVSSQIDIVIFFVCSRE